MLINSIPQYLLYLEILIYLSAVLLHTAPRNSLLIALYVFQSVLVTLMLFISSVNELSASLVLVTVLIFGVKVIVAPKFFLRFVRSHGVKFTQGAYLNLPLTLVTVAVLTLVTRTGIFQPLLTLVPASDGLLFFPLSTIFISLFLIVNNKTVLSQMIGVLSLENGILSFATLAGLEQNAALQIGIIFDLCVWIIVASVFISMVYTHFGSMDVSTMKRLKD